jgi:hypothetical protein
VRFRAQPRVRHVFVLTLGFSGRSYYRCRPNETLPQFLDAHEQAFAHFGGHTREHLYERPRTACQGAVGGHETDPEERGSRNALLPSMSRVVGGRILPARRTEARWQEGASEPGGGDVPTALAPRSAGLP